MKPLLLIAALSLSQPALAGDKYTDRVPMTGPDVIVTEQVLRCASRRVAFERNKKARSTAVRYEIVGCELEWPKPVDIGLERFAMREKK